MSDLDLLVLGITETINLQLEGGEGGRQSNGAGASDTVLGIADTQIPGVVANLMESNPNIDPNGDGILGNG